MSNELFIEGLRLLTALLSWTKRSNLSAERLLAERRKADTEGRELTAEYLADLDQKAQSAIDKLRETQPPA